MTTLPAKLPTANLAVIKAENANLPVSEEWKFHTEAPRLRETNDGDAVKKNQLRLLDVAKALGITNIDLKQIDVVYVFIVRNFGNLTLLEVAHAFELYAAGELEIKKENFGHYGSFNLEFVGVILKAYRAYAANKFAKDMKVIDASKQLPAPKPLPWKEHCESLHNGMVAHIKQHNTLPAFIWAACFFHLESSGLIKMSDSDKKKYWEEKKKELKRQKADKKNGAIHTLLDLLRKDGVITGEEKNELQSYCRSERAREYYQTLIKKEVITKAKK